MKKEFDDVWTEVRFGRVEINIGQQEEVCVNIGANQVVEIDKMYGPLSSYPVRVRLEYTEKCSDWVFEYQNPKTEQWVEKCRFDCQEDWPEAKDE